MSQVTREARKEAINNSLHDYLASKSNRTETIEYRGQKRSLEVVTLRPSVLLLNHDNSRLSAQLVDHPKREIVEKDPSSIEAQDVLRNLLRSTPQFKTLKEELKALGQQNPGMVSRDGVLINGNTRLVALQDLGASGIDVAVMPEDALAEDFLDVEMSLQMTALTHQDYSFTNQLLLRHRYIELGHTSKELARKLGWVRNAQKKIDQSERILGLVNEIRNLYLGNFPYEYFDSKQQVLIDLDNDYQRLVQANYEDAERLKWSRISAIFLGVNKDQAREIDEDFFEDEVVKRLGHKPETSDLFKVETEIVNSDLEEFLEDSIPRTDMKNFAKTLINELATAEGKILPEVDQKYTEILTQVRLAADEIITSKKLESYLAEPSDVLRETRINLDKITENFGEISEISGFNSGDFDYELKKVAKALTDLTAKYKKYLDS